MSTKKKIITKINLEKTTLKILKNDDQHYNPLG